MNSALATDLSQPGHFVVSEFAHLQNPADVLLAGHTVAVEFIADTHLHRRGLDFLSGLAYGTEARLEKLGDRIYRLKPAH